MGAIPRKPSSISFGDDRTTRTQNMVMAEWLDDDGALVAPPSSTEAPPRNTRAEVQSKGGEVVLEQQAKGVPER